MTAWLGRSTRGCPDSRFTSWEEPMMSAGGVDGVTIGLGGIGFMACVPC